MPFTPWGEQVLASLLTSEELGLINGQRAHKHWQKKYDAWAAKNPEQAERNAKAIADFQAADAEGRQAILDLNNDSIGFKPAMTSARGWDGRKVA
jgi:hypothetical protein